MDGSAYVKSKMRPLKAKSNPPKRLTRNNRKSIKNGSKIFASKKFFIELWQLLFFFSTSIFLVFTFLNQAWEPLSSKQTEIQGLSGITKNDIEKATSLFFPNNLLELNPKEIEAFLIKKLPIKEISVSRKFFPPKIHIIVKEREPVAFASRVSSNKIENGTIDIEGNWIPLEFVNQSKKNNINIVVENWSSNKKAEIGLIIKNRSNLQSPLKKIKISPIEEIIIETEYFNSVLLGFNTDRLIEQINKLNQLQESLPNLLINTKVKAVDIKDPGKPELKTEKILNERI